MKRLSILGSTGSIGKNTIEVVKTLNDKFCIISIACNNNINLLYKQYNELKCNNIVCGNNNNKKKLSKLINDKSIKIMTGIDGLIKISTSPKTDMIICATTNIVSLIPILMAIKKKKEIALANKEIIVIAGELIFKEAKKYNVKILPIDSEHCGIFQCLENKNKNHISKVILTSSGGALRSLSIKKIEKMNYKEVVNSHPTWKMGEKISVDSATMMNKAFEIIEAKWFFDLDIKQIEILIHPESIIHSMVNFIDGTTLAQMNITDMKIPIQYAISYPNKYEYNNNNSNKDLKLSKLKTLTFEKINKVKFPSIDFAYHALKCGGTMPTVMNAANDIAIEKFKNNTINIIDIWKIIEMIMNKHSIINNPTIEQILETDKLTRIKTREFIL